MTYRGSLSLPGANKGVKMTLKNYCKRRVKYGPQDGVWDFADEFLKDKDYGRRNFKTWETLEAYLTESGACDAAQDAARRLFIEWTGFNQFGPKPKKKKQKRKTKPEKIDGLSPEDIKRIRSAIRQVWSWSHPKRIAAARAVRADGFSYCEKCKKKVPKVYQDHIVPCGAVDVGFIKRMWCSSKGLQNLCKPCHNNKTKQERKDLEIEKGFL